jgi:hypothetical protein
VHVKIRRLGRLPELTVRPYLVPVGELAPAVEEARFFDAIIPLDEFLREMPFMPGMQLTVPLVTP